MPERFQWDAVCEFRIEIKKNENPDFRAWVDDIFILRDVYEPVEEKEEQYWDEREDMIDSPPLASRPEVKDVHKVFIDAPGADSFIFTEEKPLIRLFQGIKRQ